jgi:ornithine cyclodeaminase/alanine dehydrogenase-like protein (mu-crystallin family)
MMIFDEDRTRALLPWRPLIEAIRAGFRDGCEMPSKHEHFVKVAGEPDAKLLLMPAWTEGGPIAVKVAAVFPGNADRGIPAVNAAVLLMDGKTGALLALIDGGEVTARRTAASSALAADYLARRDASHLVVLGTGRLGGGNLIEAHVAVRPIRRVTIWGRSPAKAAAVAARWQGKGLAVSATEDRATAVSEADIVSTATLAAEPVLRGDWLRPGAHVDLIGNFAPTAREADDAAMRRATVFVDTRAALKTGGDLVIALANGTLRESDVAGDLYDLARGAHPGRRDNEEITLFKSVGAAVEDWAAARLVYAEGMKARG